MFSIIRLIIGLILFPCFIVVIKRLKLKNNRIVYVISLIISVILTTVLSFLPFENLFVTFNSPEKSYEYLYGSETDIKLVVNGKNSDFVVGGEDGSYKSLIIPKTKNGWKIGIGIYTKRVFYNLIENVTVCVYQYKNTDDYFITIFDTNGEKTEITDMYSSKFYVLEKVDDYLDTVFYTYYTNISEFNSEYWIAVNGVQITLLN